MRCIFECNPPVKFDEALAKLRASGRVLVERPTTRSFLYDQWTVLSLDRLHHTQMGRDSNKYEQERHTDPDAMTCFFKCAGLPREGARKFLVTVSEIIGADILTEYNESISDPNNWSVRYFFDLDAEEDET